MKKFTFSLDALFELKKTMKDKLQAEYAAAQAALDKALCVKVALDKIYLDESDKYAAKMKKRITAGDIEAHTIYFEELQEMITTATNDVARAQENVNCKQSVLVEVFKEIKVLEKLRQKQYLEYLTEAEKQEANAREEILTFNVSGKSTEQSSTGTAH